MSLKLRTGETFDFKGRRITVTELAAETVPGIRDHLVDLARAGRTTTYGELKNALALPYSVNGLGRPLDLLSIDCGRRGEPSLAALVVNASTGEVGSDFDGDPVAARNDI